MLFFSAIYKLYTKPAHVEVKLEGMSSESISYTTSVIENTMKCHISNEHLIKKY